MKLIKITPLLIFLFLISAESFSQSDSLHIIQKDSLASDNAKGESRNVPLTGWYESKSMPWIASIFVGVLTVITNLIISHYTRSTSLRIVKAQIDSSSRLANIQFQATLNSKNRQDWINDVRNAISEFSTHVRQLNIQLQEKEIDRSMVFSLHERVQLFKSKIRLLLSPQIETHQHFLIAQEDLMNVLEDHLLKSKGGYGEYNNQAFIVNLNSMVEKGREMLYSEWQKIQNAKFDSLGA